MIELLMMLVLNCACEPSYKMLPVEGHCHVTMEPPFLKQVEVPCTRYYRFDGHTGDLDIVGWSWKKGEGIIAGLPEEKRDE